MIYNAVIALSRCVFAALGLRIRITGETALPQRGAAIIAANHVSYLDFLLVGLPGVHRGRRVRFLARADLFDLPVVGWLLTRMGHIGVDRDAPAHAYLRAREALQAGEIVALFPEAGISRSYTVRAVMRGAVALSQDTGAPLFPTTVWGGQQLMPIGPWPRPRRGVAVSVVVGKQLSEDGDLAEKTVALGVQLQAQLSMEQARAEHADLSAGKPWHPHHLGGSAVAADAVPAEVANLPGTAIHPVWNPH